MSIKLGLSSQYEIANCGYRSDGISHTTMQFHMQQCNFTSKNQVILASIHIQTISSFVASCSSGAAERQKQAKFSKIRSIGKIM